MNNEDYRNIRYGLEAIGAGLVALAWGIGIAGLCIGLGLN